MTNNKVMLAIVTSGVRWSNNIITELLGNYGKHLPPEAREEIKNATLALGRAMFELNKV